MLQVRQDLLQEELSGIVPEDIYQRAVRRANLKSQLESIVSSAIRQVLGLGVDGVQIRVEPVRSVREINGKEEEVIEAFQWALTAIHPELGEIAMAGKIDAVQTSQVGQAQTSESSASSVNSGRRSNWSAVLDLAAKYGVEVREYERQKVSWYVGTILSRIAKQNPAAKNDAQWQELAQAWLANKPANAPGINA
jgi:uncharacterized alkaline shock family protein YloU